MSRNRRRYQNQVPIRMLSPGLLILVIILAFGMTRVYYSNQRVARGKEIKKLETLIKETRDQNKALQARIVELSSRAALQKRLSEGFVKMVPISQERIVQMGGPTAAAVAGLALASGELRPVSNAGGARP